MKEVPENVEVSNKTTINTELLFFIYRGLRWKAKFKKKPNNLQLKRSTRKKFSGTTLEIPNGPLQFNKSIQTLQNQRHTKAKQPMA